VLSDLPPQYRATREAMHAVAEHVIAAARYRVTGRIGLLVTPLGFGTPLFGEGEQVRVQATELAYRFNDVRRRAPITTLRAAADFVGVPLGAPPVYEATTRADPDRLLAVDPDAARVLADWYRFADGLLHELVRVHATSDPAQIQLWPEHFDLATELGDAGAGGRATYGASPGDEFIDEPYLYVSPHGAQRRQGQFATYAFGAALPYEQLLTAADPEEAGRRFLLDAATQLSA
jgi:hypothetical protein